MEEEKLIRNATFILSFVAGFSDTATFVAAGELFSAHVTGNFIVFAYDVIKSSSMQSWQKLITFPVFILSVMAGGWIGRNSVNKNMLLILEGVLLVFCGTAAFAVKNPQDVLQWQVQFIALVVVVAMGFQNTFGKLFNKMTFGLTTVMTGNVTQSALDFVSGITSKIPKPEAWISFRKQLVMIFGFLIGCVSGALIAANAGLCALLLPGVVLLLWLRLSS